MLKVADNTGALKLQCIRVLGGYQQRTAGLADVVTCVVKEARPYGTVKKADIVHAVLVRVHKETRRPDGTYIRFDDGRCMCIARCSSFGIEEGASCGDGFTCRHIQSVTSGNHATVCVADAWNVCLHGQVAAPETHRRRGLRD